MTIYIKCIFDITPTCNFTKKFLLHGFSKKGKNMFSVHGFKMAFFNVELESVFFLVSCYTKVLLAVYINFLGSFPTLYLQ